ncbi:MAG: hypothetical protein CVU52_08855 [Deltaproteobacteria bacterium HGW-Deltaproteobacteria-10]|nr:MAG: hypothetical protein CVU52_08855 [Deltaproteobacteria bacterium HGW-Deltaproteobacteria-10]
MKIINYIYRIAKKKAGVSGIIALAVCWTLTFPAYAKEINLTSADHQRIIKMNVGDRLEITLEGNPTTGYVWEKVEGDNEILLRQGDYQYTPAEPLLLGSGGKFTFTFLGAAGGKTRLRIIYHRTFEKNIDPVKIFEVLVIIK